MKAKMLFSKIRNFQNSINSMYEIFKNFRTSPKIELIPCDIKLFHDFHSTSLFINLQTYDKYNQTLINFYK